MALQKKHIVKIVYKQDSLVSPRQMYTGVLTETQLSEMEETLTKSFIVDDAYHRVEKLVVSKTEISFELAIYNSAIDKLIGRRYYTFVPDVSEGSVNYHTQTYEYLKTLTEYVDAIDV